MNQPRGCPASRPLLRHEKKLQIPGMRTAFTAIIGICGCRDVLVQPLGGIMAVLAVPTLGVSKFFLRPHGGRGHAVELNSD